MPVSVARGILAATSSTWGWRPPDKGHGASLSNRPPPSSLTSFTDHLFHRPHYAPLAPPDDGDHGHEGRRPPLPRDAQRLPTAPVKPASLRGLSVRDGNCSRDHSQHAKHHVHETQSSIPCTSIARKRKKLQCPLWWLPAQSIAIAYKERYDRPSNGYQDEERAADCQKSGLHLEAKAPGPKGSGTRGPDRHIRSPNCSGLVSPSTGRVVGARIVGNSD